MGKVAVSILGTGEGLAAPMDGRFGRADRFLIVDPDADEVLQTVVNPARDASHGAGPAAATLMKDLAVESVISGRYGPKASDTLSALGIRLWIAPPDLTAGEALALLRAGRLDRDEKRVFR